MEKESNLSRFSKTYSGRKLLEEHSLDEEGTWEVRGEDPNCDLGGHHHEPFLGYYKGKLSDVIELAVDLPGFWQWGGGDRIFKSSPRKVTKVVAKAERRSDDEVKKLENKLAKKRELEDRFALLQQEMRALSEEIKKL